MVIKVLSVGGHIGSLPIKRPARYLWEVDYFTGYMGSVVVFVST